MRDKFGRFIKGHFVPREWKESYSEKNSGRKFSEETLKKRSKAFSGSKNPTWKGGKEIYHRRIARKIMGIYGIGEYTRKGAINGKGQDKIVHHIDGNIKNNNPINLVIMTRSEHTKLHWQQNDIRGD